MAINNQNFRVKNGLEVGASGSNLHVTSDGKVGINTTDPLHALDVRGNLSVGSSVTAESFHGDIPSDNLTGTISTERLTGTYEINISGNIVGDSASANVIGVSTINVFKSLNVGVGSTGVFASSDGDLTVTGNLIVQGDQSSISIESGTINGPSEIIIDPAPVGVGTTSGAVYIKGDLYVQGSQFQVDSTTVNIADKVIGIATTCTTNTLLDGAGIGIGPDNNQKTFTFEDNGDNLKSSENLNLADSKSYKINGNTVLSSTQVLGKSVTSNNTNSTIVARDSSGNFNAGTISADLTGTASKASNLAINATNSLLIQTSNNNTSTLSNSNTVGYLLKSNATNAAPGWVNPTTLIVGYAASAGIASTATAATSAESADYATSAGTASNADKVAVAEVADTNTDYHQLAFTKNNPQADYDLLYAPSENNRLVYQPSTHTFHITKVDSGQAAGIVTGAYYFGDNAQNFIAQSSPTNLTGSNNIIIGTNDGYTLTGGSHNIIIGSGTTVNDSDGDKQLVIGAGRTDRWISGDSNFNIGIGHAYGDTISARLDVKGNIKEELHSPTMPVGLNNDIGTNWIKVGMASTHKGIYDLEYCGNGIVLACSGYYESGEGTIYRSTDYGKTWIKNEIDSNLNDVNKLLHCGNGIVLAEGDGGTGISNVRYLYRSTDYGQTWELSSTNFVGGNNLLYCGDGIVLTSYGADVYKSTDFGLNWSNIASLGVGDILASLVYCGNGIIVAGTGGATSGTGDIYRSTDFGSNWTKIEISTLGLSDIGQSGSLYAIRTLVYCGNGIVVAGSYGRTSGSGYGDAFGDIYRSADYGKTWTLIKDLPSSVASVRSIVYCGNGIVLAGVSDSSSSEIYKSTDFGLNWTAVDEIDSTLLVIQCLVYCGNGIVLGGALGSNDGDGNIYRSDVGFSQASTIQGIYHEHLTGNIGIGITQPTTTLDVAGDVNVSGSVTATSFVGVAQSATKVYVDESEDDNQYYNIIFSDENPDTGDKYHTLQVDDGGIAFNPNANRLYVGGSISLKDEHTIVPITISHTSTPGISSTIDTFPISSYDLAEYTIHVGYGTYSQAQKVLVMLDGTTVYSQEYAVMHSSNRIVSIEASIFGSNVLLQATPETGVSGITTYKIVRGGLV